MYKRRLYYLLFFFLISGLSLLLVSYKLADKKTYHQPLFLSFTSGKNTIAPLTFPSKNIVANSNANDDDTTPEPVTICSGSSTQLSGKSDYTFPPDTYSWEVQQGSTWINAPGTNNQPNYAATLLVNNTSADIVYNLRRKITQGANVSYDSYKLVTVHPSGAIANNTITPPAVTTFCNTGGSTSITGSTPTGGSGTFSYQWQSSTDNATFTDVAGATGKDFNVPQVNATTYYRRIVAAGPCTIPSASNTVAIVVLPPVTASSNTITAPPTISFCSGGDPSTITGSTPTGGDGTYTYQWQSSADNAKYTDIPGANTKDYDPQTITTTTYYRRTVTSGSCNTPVTSNVVTITVIPPLAGNTINAPAVSAFCGSGNADVIVGSTPTGASGTYTYQWQSSNDNTTFTNISGATTKDYDPPLVNVTTYYRRVVNAGSCVPAAPGNVVAITISSPLTNNTITPPAVTSFCTSGDPAIITGNIPSGGDGTYAYQWQSSTDNITFTDVTGATSRDYDPGNLTVTTYFRRLVTSGTCTTPLASNFITFTILTTVANNTVAAPSVTSFCASGNPANMVGSTPTGATGTYTYQWQQSTDNTTFTNIAGATSKDYDPGVITTTMYYRRTVVSGSCSTPVISNVVTFNVVPLPATPAPTQSTVNICPGTAATLSVPAQTGVTYNWYDSPARSNLLFTGNTYVTPVLNSSRVYYVEGSNGSCTSSTLATVQVNITTPPANPVVNSPAASICSGSSTVLSVSSPQAGVTYTWYTAASGGAVVTTGTSFTTPALTASTTYYVEAANAGSCTSASRTPVTVNVAPLPQATVQGASVCPGSSATLQATANVPNATIRWYANANGGSVLATGATYTTPVLNADVTYYVEVINNATSCVSATRQAVQVQLLRPLTTPDVTVATTTSSSITFKWNVVSGATGYEVSINNGQTYTAPSSGTAGLTHVVSGLQQNQSVTILVRALAGSVCKQSNTGSATGEAISQTDEIYVANAFTPNGDGKNDVVQVHSENIKTVMFSIYSQWGELLFQSTNPNTGWDGTYKGVTEPVGVYIYYLKAVMNNGHEVNKKGTITLLR